MNLKYKYYCQLYILTTVFIVNESQARKCYVCGDEGDPPCTNFEMDKEIFSKQCNPSDQACLLKIAVFTKCTKVAPQQKCWKYFTLHCEDIPLPIKYSEVIFEGRKRVRTCEKERIEDCKIANGVKYCFCTTDLCNDDDTRFITPTDDEDILEGSGVKMIPTLTEKPQVSIVASPSNSGSCSIFILLLSGLLILA